jgi:hypothetical protein
MFRRFLWMAAIPCLAAILLLNVSGCGASKTTENPTVPDPDGDYVPKPGSARPG